MRKNIVDELRVNWAEDAKRIAEAGDDVLVWPQFSNEDDDMAGNAWADNSCRKASDSPSSSGLTRGPTATKR